MIRNLNQDDFQNWSDLYKAYADECCDSRYSLDLNSR